MFGEKFEYKCRTCGKVIGSWTLAQLRTNAKHHVLDKHDFRGLELWSRLVEVDKEMKALELERANKEVKE